MSGTAKECVFNHGASNYASLRMLVRTMFQRTVSRYEIYRQLRARKLKSSESCISYVVAMQSIASKMDIEEEELVDLIIDGIPDISNNLSILYGANTMCELIRRMDRYEQRRSMSSTAKSYATTVTRNPRPKAPSAAGSGDLTSVRCYNCSQFGHYQSSCPKPYRPPGACFTCHQMGHRHNDCPKKRNRVTSVALVSEGSANEDDAINVKQWSN
ncbi:uncharacterized protein LOC118752169 isoform X2 [Rhagoletis pomonella]|uniref:uncharacterized protein LOC118751692 isoform X2 n=1 Tax=Rhagoletis pomonella TaxID=28610 RepID=UPI00177D2D21|nr:uncharacterized protein LOC118751692 isoform X2 [Rhagoletis pomonella]XP_036342918.1 uncharacterized protein LOC118752169 isoform X2 [Rhagoletis pomonella]